MPILRWSALKRQWEMFDQLLDALNSDTLPAIPAVHYFGDIVIYREFRQKRCFPDERGAACLTLDGDFIHAYGLFQAVDPSNRALRDNQETWLLGDVFELFFRYPGHEDYYEFHSTPEGRRLQLHIQDYRTFRNLPHEQKICQSGLMVKNRIDHEKKLWFSELIIPRNGSSADSAHFAFARYSYTDGVPEISSYPEFPETVHTPYLWPEIKIHEGKTSRS